MPRLTPDKLDELILDCLAAADDELSPTVLAGALHQLGARNAAGRALTARDLALPLKLLMGEHIYEQNVRVGHVAERAEDRRRLLIRTGRYDEVAAAVAHAEPLVTRSLSYYTAYERAYHFTANRPGTVRRELRRAMRRGEVDLAESMLAHCDVDLATWYASPLEVAEIQALPQRLALEVMRDVAEIPHIAATSVVGLRELLELLIARDDAPEYLALRAEIDAYAGLDTSAYADRLAPEDLGTVALSALQQGDTKRAVTLFAKAVAARRKVNGSSKATDASPCGLFAPLAYLSLGDATRHKQGLRLLELGGPEGSVVDTDEAGWPFLEALETGAPLPSDVPTHPVGALIAGLTMRWSGRDLPEGRLEEAEAWATRCGWTWVADELRHVIDDDGEGLLALRTVQTDWERRMDAVLQLLGGKPKAPEEKKSRLIWTLTVFGASLSLEAREQTRQRTGWSGGRAVSNERLTGARGTPPPMTDEDRALVAALRTRTYRGWSGYNETEWVWSAAIAWPAMIGHPRLVSRDGATLTVVERKPRLVVTKTKRGSRVRVEPTPNESLVVTPVGDRGYEVTSFTPTQLELYKLISAGFEVPKSGADALKTLMDAASQHFETTDVSAQAELAGSPDTVVLLRPVGQGLSAELVVQPLGQDGPTLHPGVGGALVLATKNDASVRVRRDLKAELEGAQAASALLDGCANFDGALFLAPDPQDALALLAAAHDAELRVLWPDGAKLRLVRPDAKRSMSVSVTSASDWFEARGELACDDGQVLALDALLSAVLRSSGRFVTLDDGTYLELSERLRHQLDALGRAARRKRGRVELHALASDALAPLVADLSATVDAGWTERQARLAALPAAPAVPRDLQATLRGYQEDAFRWLARLAEVPAGAILADDMGLGKTLVALTLLLHRRADGPALVLAPTSVAGNWEREARRFAPTLNVHMLRDGQRAELLAGVGPGDVVLASYGLLLTEADALKAVSWSTLVLDESQALKNPSTKRHKAATHLAARMRLSLTGTPIENHLGELHAQFALVNPGLFGAVKDFRDSYQKPVEAGDRDVGRLLQRAVSPYLLRRTKAEVLDDLPARTEVDVLVELEPAEAAFYESLRRRALEALEPSDGRPANPMSVLAELTRLRQAACSPRLIDPSLPLEGPKLRAFIEIVERLREGGHRALVFSQFVAHLSLLRAWLDAEQIPYGYLDGSTPSRERDRQVEAFQAGTGDLFLISLKAGGVGLNLTAADYVVHMDPWWNPAVEDQASDRAHRMGQTRPVTIYRLIAKGTVEEPILALHHRKRAIADDLLSGADVAAKLTAEELAELLRGGGAAKE